MQLDLPLRWKYLQWWSVAPLSFKNEFEAFVGLIFPSNKGKRCLPNITLTTDVKQLYFASNRFKPKRSVFAATATATSNRSSVTLAVHQNLKCWGTEKNWHHRLHVRLTHCHASGAIYAPRPIVVGFLLLFFSTSPFPSQEDWYRNIAAITFIDYPSACPFQHRGQPLDGESEKFCRVCE